MSTYGENEVANERAFEDAYEAHLAAQSEPEYRVEGLTAAEHHAAADECYRQKVESWARSDTDGFRSQAACDAIARRHSNAAQLCDARGQIGWTGLYHKATGKRVAAKLVTTKFGQRWLVYKRPIAAWDIYRGESCDAELWLPSGENSRKQKQLGLEEREELVETGLSNYGSGFYRKDKGCPIGATFYSEL